MTPKFALLCLLAILLGMLVAHFWGFYRHIEFLEIDAKHWRKMYEVESIQLGSCLEELENWKTTGDCKNEKEDK